jgi:hypothetical protein
MNPFPLFQPDAPMLGRKELFEQLCNELTKPTPAHLSLVGPRYHGKSVILHALVAEMRQRPDVFHRVIYWDLGHRTPQSDDEFLTALRAHIARAIKNSHAEWAEYLEDSESGYDELHEVIGNIMKSDEKILIVWDGFDRPLREGRLTRNLWDNLLELCRMQSFRAVTASRRKLQELPRDEKSVTSELWEVFTVKPVGCLTSTDLVGFTTKMPDHTFQPGAIKELINWTGGLPAIVTWLIGKIAEQLPPGIVTNEHVNEAAVPDDRCCGIMDKIWQDCPAPATDLYRHLVESGSERISDLPKPEKSALLDHGLARQEGSMLVPTCRLIEKYVGAAEPEFGALSRLFGTWEGYAENIRGILERRIAQISRFDNRLFRMVEQGIENIPGYPDDCLNNLTHIEERALDLIWQHESDDERCFPPQVISYWSEVTLKLQGNKRHWIMSEMLQSDENGTPNAWSVSSDRTSQLTLLQFLTGSHQAYNKPVATKVSKDTYTLLNAIHSFRNRSQHASGQTIHLGVAVSAIMLCVELLACLQRELTFKDTTAN